MRLTTKLSALLSGLALAVLASTVLPLYWAEEAHLLEQREARQFAELQQFGRVCGDSLREGDAAARLGFLKTFILFAEPKTVAWALFADERGGILLHSDFLHGDRSQGGRAVSGLEMGRALSARSGLRQRLRAPGRELDLLSAPVYDVSAPEGKKRLGTAFIAYDHDALAAASARLQRESLSRVLQASWLGLALGLLLAFLLGRALIRPIEALGGGARRIAEGRLDTRIAEARSDELGDLARDFNVMAARLAEVDELKDAFLAQITHDLRSPLSAIVTCVDTLALGALGGVTPEQAKCLGVAASNADYLGSLIGDMLDLSRMEAGRLELSPSRVDLGELAQAVLGLLRPKAEEYGVLLDAAGVREGATVWADEQALKRVLVNLVSNALKFTPPGGRVSIAHSVVDGQDRAAVSDTGIGVPADKLGTLFKKFTQIPETKDKVRPARGTGLGLAICKQLVEAHGGRVGAESEYRKGAVFFFTLPREGSQEALKPESRGAGVN
ncbi:MAG: HAMP domain-containing histidine kinase [Elusimicrobia bacterium]|nr:HAMP domain-containing histidine kinase [Elusimicrobiota bacterium]